MTTPVSPQRGPTDAVKAVALLRRWKQNEPGPHPYLGTCFAFRWQNRYITAAHCLQGIPDDEIAIESGPARGFESTVGPIHRHPTADVAVIESSGIAPADAPIDPFQQIGNREGLGEEFYAFGYPVDVLGPDSTVPTPRLFKGYFQRFLPPYKTAYSGYTYSAAELSFACPGGLSGGPIFRTMDFSAVLGVATENLQSTTTLDAVEELSIGGAPQRRTEYRQVISYGTALMLADVADWIDEHVPQNPKGIVGSVMLS